MSKKDRKRPTKLAGPHVWTDEEVARVLQLDAYGKLSCVQIADQMTEDFGRPYTKNVVLCKLNRLKGNISDDSSN